MQAERMASAQNNTRELRLLKAVERIGEELSLLNSYLGLYLVKTPPEEPEEPVEHS
jgi:hypothetical protein